MSDRLENYPNPFCGICVSRLWVYKRDTQVLSKDVTNILPHRVEWWR